MGADQQSCVGRGHKDTPKRPKHGAALMQPARVSQYMLRAQARHLLQEGRAVGSRAGQQSREGTGQVQRQRGKSGKAEGIHPQPVWEGTGNSHLL